MRMQDSNTFWTKKWKNTSTIRREVDAYEWYGCDSWFVIAVSIVHISIQLTSSSNGVCIKGLLVSIAGLQPLQFAHVFGWFFLGCKCDLSKMTSQCREKVSQPLALKMNFPNGILEYVGSAYTRSGAKDPAQGCIKDGTGPSAIGQRFKTRTWAL